MYSEAVQQLINELGKLPGIGPKGAQRIAFYVLKSPPEYASNLAQALSAVKERVQFCELCGNFAEAKQCLVCANPRRSTDLICIVEEAKDVEAIERTGGFHGKYHVLGGAIDPINNVGPDNLNIASLMRRLSRGQVRSDFSKASSSHIVGSTSDDSENTSGIGHTDSATTESAQVKEVILATNPNVAGEATAAYLARLIAPLGVTVSRLALGLPVGGDLEYADEITLGRAFRGRQPVE